MLINIILAISMIYSILAGAGCIIASVFIASEDRFYGALAAIVGIFAFVAGLLGLGAML